MNPGSQAHFGLRLGYRPGMNMSASDMEAIVRMLNYAEGKGCKIYRNGLGGLVIEAEPGTGGEELAFSFRCTLSTREPGEEEGEDPIRCVRVTPGAWSTAGSDGTMFPLGSPPVWSEEGNEWLWDADAGELTIDLPATDATSFSLVLYWDFSKGEAGDWPVLWWTTEDDAPDVATAAHYAASGTNAERAIALCRIYQTITGEGETEKRSYRLQQVQFGAIRLFVPPVATRGMIATLSPVRRRAEEGQSIYKYDDSTPPELVQVEAEGGEEYFDEAGNPVYSNAGMPWIADWLRFDDLEYAAIFEPPEQPAEPEE